MIDDSLAGSPGGSGHHRAPRTFRLRRRSLGDTRVAQYERLLGVFGLAIDMPVDDVDTLFRPTSDGPVRYVLDIGFGYGDALIELARARPQERVIGIEVHTPGVANVLDAIERHDLGNVRVVEGDAVEFLAKLPDASFDCVRVWFPDPWIKRRQHGRRLISDATIAAVATLLVPGGTVHLATDIDDYAAHMQIVMEGAGVFAGGVVDRPSWRPVTGYEERGRRAGRNATDLIYTRHVSTRVVSSSHTRPGVG